MSQLYYTVHFPSQEAVELLTEIPDTYMQITGVKNIPVEKLRSLDAYGYPDYGIVPEQDIAPYELNPDSLIRVRNEATEKAKITVRADRDSRLSKSDRKVMPDRWDTYSPETKVLWATYRQELRDMPSTIVDWLDPIWPVEPA